MIVWIYFFCSSRSVSADINDFLSGKFDKEIEFLQNLIPIFAIPCCRPQIIQTLNSYVSNNLSLKNQKPTPPGCKDIIR